MHDQLELPSGDRNRRTLLIVVESLEECQKFLLIPAKNSFYLGWLLRVGDEYLASNKVKWVKQLNATSC